MMLWTFVVISSAVYVIALSGDLIPISAGTLVLLAASRALATVISKARRESAASGCDLRLSIRPPRQPRWRKPKNRQSKPAPPR